MQRSSFQKLAVVSFLIYCALFPGSTMTVALHLVPGWGIGMGGALLLLQGLSAIFWLLGSYGQRGGWAGIAAFGLAWGVEHMGETTGLPFGRYQYTDLLQPQLFNVVPIPITCAWIMVALGAWQLAEHLARKNQQLARPWARSALAATMVVGLDLQIETIATRVNPYWAWSESGPYYGVPSANFIAWWVVGLIMALVLRMLLATRSPTLLHEAPTPIARVFAAIPALLYLLSSLMFTVINLAHGFTLAGTIGLCMLGTVTLSLLSGRNLAFGQVSQASQQTSD